MRTPPPPVPVQPGTPGNGREQQPMTAPWMQQQLQNPLILACLALLLVATIAAWFFWRRRKRVTVVLPDQAAISTEDVSVPELPEAHEAGLLQVGASVRPIRTARIEQLARTLREHIADDPALAASVLRNWLRATAERRQ